MIISGVQVQYCAIGEETEDLRPKCICNSQPAIPASFQCVSKQEIIFSRLLLSVLESR
jgi:hypothetical protein